jgi:hypothetical protein
MEMGGLSLNSPLINRGSTPLWGENLLCNMHVSREWVYLPRQ